MVTVHNRFAPKNCPAICLWKKKTVIRGGKNLYHITEHSECSSDVGHCVPKSRSTGYTQKNGAVSKVNKKFISQLTRA